MRLMILQKNGRMLDMDDQNVLRRPGGQPNNRNAYKHGFYSRHFSSFEGRALSEIPLADLSAEIGLLRVNVDRFMQAYAASLEKLDYASRLAGLRAITLAVGRIAAMQRIQSTTAGDRSEMVEYFKVLSERVGEEDLRLSAPGKP